MPAPLIIPLGPWLPDLLPFNNTLAAEALNVIPAQDGYRPIRAPSAFSAALATKCLGAIGTVDNAGTYRNYAGTATKLYELTSATAWTDRTRSSGGDYATASGEVWNFTQFGNTLIATNFTDDVQSIELGGTNFAALGGSPPKARYIATIRDFVAMANLNDGTAKPQDVRWSGINNAASWTASRATMSDSQTIRGEHGWIQALVGGEYGVVLRERSMVRMDFIGPPAVFQFSDVEGARGTPSPQSACRYGRLVFYLGEDGFYAFDGGQSSRIGSEQVDRYFASDLDVNYFNMVWGAADMQNAVVAWAYPGPGNNGGVPNRILFYHVPTQRWSRAEIEAELLSSLYSSLAYTMDTLDSIYPNLDLAPGSLDDRLYSGGSFSFCLFDANHKLSFFTGANMAATIDTSEFQPFSPRRSFMQSVRPIVDGGTVTIKIGARDKLQDDVSMGAAVSVNQYTGEAHSRSSGRYHRCRVQVASGSDWSRAQGVEITRAKPEGLR